jgi:O-antigen/teichoic acid export membrane protein
MAMVVGNGAFAASQFLVLVALTSATSPEVVGRYALGLAVTAPAFFAANLKLRQVAISDTQDEFTAGQYVGARLTAITVVWVLVAAVSIWTSLGGLLIGIASMKALDMACDIFYALPHRTGHLGRISASLAIRGLASAAVFYAVVTRFESVEAAVWATVAVYAVALPFDIVYARKFDAIRPVLSWGGNKALFVISVPLGLAMAASSIGTMLPRYALQITQGAREVGIYSAVAYLLVITGLVINSVAQAASPPLSASLAAGDIAHFRYQVTRLTTFGVALGAAGALGSALVGRQVLRLLYGPEYESAHIVLIILMVAAALSYSALFVGTALNALRRFDVPLKVTLTSASVAAVLLLPVTNRWGMEGAAGVTVIAAALEHVLYRRAMRRELRNLHGG